jgi:hypothetical protein
MAHVALIEVIERDGRVSSAVRVARWPATVGRAVDCDVVVSDPFSAPLHLRLDPPEDGTAGLVLAVGETVNGARWMGRHFAAGASTRIPGEAQIEFGRTVLRIRTGDAALLPERSLVSPRGATPMRFAVVGAAALLLWIAFTEWLENVPGAGWDHYLLPLVAAAFACIAWGGIWGLASKLFQHHFTFGLHLRVLIAFALAFLAVDATLDIVAFAFSWPFLSRVRSSLNIAAFVALLATHTALLLPSRRRVIVSLACALCLLWVGVTAALNWRHHQRLFKELYAGTILPPVMRVAPARPVDDLLARLRPLEARLSQQARDDDLKDPADKILSESD